MTVDSLYNLMASISERGFSFFVLLISNCKVNFGNFKFMSPRNLSTK